MPAGEIVTRDIVHDSLEKGKTVYVPYLVDTSTSSETKDNKPGSRRRQMDMVSLHFWADFQRCEENRDRWGIPTISSDSLSDRSWILNQSISVSQTDARHDMPLKISPLLTSRNLKRET